MILILINIERPHANSGCSQFKLSLDNLKHNSTLPNFVALESYVKAFQYKILSFILYTKICFIVNDLCSFKTLYHFLYLCPYSKSFWSEFELYWYLLTVHAIQLTLQDVVVIITSSQSTSYILINYFIIIGKLHLWDCRRNS